MWYCKKVFFFYFKNYINIFQPFTLKSNFNSSLQNLKAFNLFQTVTLEYFTNSEYPQLLW